MASGDLETLLIRVLVATTMVALGARMDIADLLRPLGRLRGLAALIVLNVVAVPALALLLGKALDLSPAAFTGLLAVACCCGSAITPTFVQLARGDTGLAIALMVALSVAAALAAGPVFSITMGLGPAVDASAIHVDALAISMSLVLFQLVPLGLALAARHRAPEVTQRVGRWATRLSNLALVIVVPVVVAARWDGVGVAGPASLVAALLLTLGAFLMGTLVGRADAGSRRAMGLGTAQRGLGLALLLATQTSVGDAAADVVGVGLLMLAVNLVLALLVGRASRAQVPGLRRVAGAAEPEG